MTFDLLLTNGTVHLPGGPVRTSIGVTDGRIAAIGTTADAGRTLDCTGLNVLPGVIDSQVHFREPGGEHKEDLESGSRSAVLGGVTAVFEMPNTNPNTDSAVALQDKLDRARDRMWCDHAFYVGATAHNTAQLAELERLPGAAGVKIFMGSSTGSLLVAEDAALLAVLRNGQRRVAIHAEDEARLIDRAATHRVQGDVTSHPVWRDPESALTATRRILALSAKTRRPVHVLHITTPDELDLIARHRDLATCEVTPQHLTLTDEAYRTHGTHAQMNPPIRAAEYRDGLWARMVEGLPDVMGSDHAPHTAEEKARPYPASPSGMPGVQTLLPLMLDHVAAGRLTLQRLIELTSAGPQRVFGIAGKGRIAKGYDADFSIVDLKRDWTITGEWLASRARWSPFEGRRLTGAPVGTIVRGAVAMWEGELGETATGRPVRFVATA